MAGRTSNNGFQEGHAGRRKMKASHWCKEEVIEMSESTASLCILWMGSELSLRLSGLSLHICTVGCGFQDQLTPKTS